MLRFANVLFLAVGLLVCGVSPAGPGAAAVDDQALAIDLYPLLLSGDPQSLERAFAGEPVIDSPRSGSVRGGPAWRRFLQEERAWWMQIGARPETLKAVRTTKNTHRVVHEMTIEVPVGGRPSTQKLAVVADAKAGKVTAVRVYYSYGHLSGDRGFLRRAMLPHDPATFDVIAPPVRKYVDAIAASDQLAWRLFTSEGYFNGPNSVPMTGALLKKFYAVLGAEPGGVPLRPVSVTCDASSCAIEENLASWGRIVFDADTAGLAAYDFDSATGLLTGARVYDDIPVTPFSKRGWISSNWTAISDALERSGCQVAFRPGPTDPPNVVLGGLFSAACQPR